MRVDEPSRVYLPGLDGLRFLGALAVVVHHVEQFKSLAHIPGRWLHPIVQSLGHQGVNLFFTLSGFLITWLLLSERQRTGDISISRFMVRRALRILPLYYMVVLLAFAVMPGMVGGADRADGAVRPLHEALEASHAPVLILFLLVLPNVALLLYPPMPFAAHGGSIGFEEQFYLVWPWVLRLAGRRVAWVAGGALVAYLGVRFLPSASVKSASSLAAPWGFLARYLLALPVEYLSAGALAAVLFSGTWSPPGHALVVNRYWQMISLPLVVLLLCGVARLGHFNALAYAVVILNFIACRARWQNLEQPVFRYLGRISYGIYMLHPLAIYIAMKLADGFLPRGVSRGWYNASLYGASLLLTLALAALSHRYYERWFLNLRGTFETSSLPRPHSPVKMEIAQ